MRRIALLLLALAAMVLGACGDDDNGGGDSGDSGKITVYSGREEELVGDLFKQFEKETGVDVEVRYGDSAELAATLAEEGANSPADVFLSQDAGALGAVADRDLMAILPLEALGRVQSRFRDEQGRWVGVSGRARVLAYNTGKLDRGDLPSTIFDLTDARWKGKLGLPPSNASFQAFVSAMRIEVGDERTRDWLEKIDANDPKLFEDNDQTAAAVAKGEIDGGLVNHYYLYEVKEELGEVPLDVHFFRAGDPGALVNVAGAGILKSSENQESARRLIEYLTTAPGQRYFAQETDEYPLITGVKPREDLKPLDEVKGPDIELGELGPKLPSTLEMIEEVGLTN
jgi:iron(III) transport system substrate-binding protein